MNKTETEQMVRAFLVQKGIFPSGKVFYVCNATAREDMQTGVDNAANGRRADYPLATLDYAVGLCTAGAGDTIVCLPGHAETVNAAAFITMDISGVTVVGIGNGNARPTFTWATDTASTIVMTAANCRFTNCIFDLRLPSALVSGIVISAAGCKIDNCLCRLGTAGTGTAPLQWILTTAAADYLTIEDNRVTGPPLTPTTIAAATGCIAIVGGTGIMIQRNNISGWFTATVGAISCVTTLTNNICIRDNHIINQTASGTKCITLLTGSTGTAGNNRFSVVAGGTATAPITGDALGWSGNWSSAAGANGTLI